MVKEIVRLFSLHFWVLLVYTTAQVQILKKCHLFYHEEHEGLEGGAVFASMRFNLIMQAIGDGAYMLLYSKVHEKEVVAIDDALERT